MSRYMPIAWQAKLREDGLGWLVIDDLDNPIAKGLTHEQACFIAAAPEVLAALDYAENVLQANFATSETIEGRRAITAINKSRAAIVRATMKG